MSRLSPVVPATAVVATIMALAWCLATMGTATPAGAANLSVPKDYGTIQAAINAANDDDTTRITIGIYPWNVTITKNITLKGGWNSDCKMRLSTLPQGTVIDGSAAGSVVSMPAGARPPSTG